jgi:dihydrofolate reductase
VRKLIVSEFLTLDGVMEAPETWQFPYFSPDVQEIVVAQINGVDAFLYGRVTYDIFSEFWPKETEDKLGFETHLNSAPKYVVSTTLKKANWADTTIIKKDPMAEIARLKDTPGSDIGITGSCTLIRSLVGAGLVDEFQLLVHPLVLGKGMRLFADGLDTAKLKLVEERALSSGVVRLVYQVEK